MQDIRIGRKSKYSEIDLAVTGGTATKIPGRGGRIRLSLDATGGTTVWLSSRPGGNQGQGIGFPLLNNGQWPLRVEDYGPWLEGDLYALTDGIGGTLTVTEVWLDDQNP